MARNEMVSCPVGVWTQLTNADVALDMSIALIDGTARIQATTTSAAPALDAEGLPVLSHGDGFSEATIPEKFPNDVTNDRLWAMPLGDVAARIFVVHGA